MSDKQETSLGDYKWKQAMESEGRMPTARM